MDWTDQDVQTTDINMLTDTQIQDILDSTTVSDVTKTKLIKSLAGVNDIQSDDEEIVDDHKDVIDESKLAFAKVLEYVTNTFYRTDENKEIAVQVVSGNKAGNYYDTQKIVLSEGLIDAFGELNLPRFLVYYHELGHHLYSQGLFILEEKWAKINQGPLQWHDKYHHLVNWIEDYYIEDMLVKEHPYLTDVVSCIKKLPPDYDINRIEYAFNFWYINQAPTPALQYTDQIAFKAYVIKLLNLRSTSTRFGHGILTTLSMKQSVETRFAMLLIEFYNWCVARNIFPKDKSLPKLNNPNNHIEQPGQGDAAPGDTQQDNGTPADSGGGAGSYSAHSGQVGKVNGVFKEVTHIKNATTVFKEEVAAENKLVNKEVLDMSQRIQADTATLDGLFNTKYKESAIIQPKVIVPNFFNPNRLVDQVLFQEKQHSYMNVAIYRDISGSTTGNIHKLMHVVCEQLYKDIPVDITYYLYGSGDVSIVEIPYIPWENSSHTPAEYSSNPQFNKIERGTNSSAIADVITQQLSEKWLNIIITDGDLDDLMQRDNILSLLKNVFVVAVNAPVEDGLLGVEVNNIGDIEQINSVLMGINLDQ